MISESNWLRKWQAPNINQNSFHPDSQLICQHTNCLRVHRLLNGSHEGDTCQHLRVMPTGNLIPGDARRPWRSHSPSCLHLAPQQQSILGRLFLFVIFSLHTDILDLRRDYTNAQVIVQTATEIKVLPCRLLALNVSKLSGSPQTPPELGFLVYTQS